MQNLATSSSADTLKDPYLVRPGDTLSAIAKRCGRSVGELQRLNNIRNANQLAVGQTLYLSERSAYGVTVSFLDMLRHPIENLAYQLRYDGKTVQGVTGSSGLVPRQVTKDARSQIEVWVKNAQQQWQQIANTVSGHGHKLLTLVSPALVVPGRTEELPFGAPALPASEPPPKPAAASPAKPQGQVPLPKPATGTPSKNNPAVKTKKKKGPQGQSIVEISVEIPPGLLNHFDKYTGKEITDEAWKNVAVDLECEPEVLQAIARVESGGRSAFWRLNKSDGASIPAILYERHYFSRLTDRKYDATYPDISWPTGYRKGSQLGKKDKKMHDNKVDQDDIYGSYSVSYLRLINAYRIDPDAALQSCSWGKFQVMGANYETCGAERLGDFIDAMCTSELGQVNLLAGFIQNKPRAWKNPKDKSLGKEMSLWDAVKTKNWRAIAFNYNGPGYSTFSYDTKLEAAYEAIKGKK